MAKEESKNVVIQDIRFNLDGMKGFKKADFLKTFKSLKDKAKGKGKFGRFDEEKGWEELQEAIKK